MKRRKFFASLGLAAAAATVPAVAQTVTSANFAHVPEDYADFQDGAYEFEELDEALTDEQFKMDIIWE